MNTYEKWFMDACDDLDGVDPKDAWNAAIDEVLKIIYYHMDDGERQCRVEELRS